MFRYLFQQTFRHNCRRWQLIPVLAGWCLVWALAWGLASTSEVADPFQTSVTMVLSAPDDTAVITLPAGSEHSSASLFLHAKQQPVYTLVFAPVILLLWLLAKWCPQPVVPAWYIRAGPRRSFRLSLWRDANLCCKRQLYHERPLLVLKI